MFPMAPFPFKPSQEAQVGPMPPRGLLPRQAMSFPLEGPIFPFMSSPALGT